MPHPRPKVCISRCLGFDACRWNGVTIDDPFVAKLRAHAEAIAPCPEADIGLGVPRPPIRIIRRGEEERLVQPETGRDITEAMNEFVRSFLDELGEVDGFLLKYRSPSCGLANVKLYDAPEQKGAVGKTAGFFGRMVKARFAAYPIEDEGRLHNFEIREHFLTRLYLHADWRQTRRNGTVKALVAFHTRNKELLRLYNQTRKTTLGRLVAEARQHDLPALFAAYAENLFAAFAKRPRRTAVINVLEHAVGHMKKQLSAADKRYFKDLAAKYRDARLPLSALSSVVRGWALHHGQEYFLRQTVLAPYPETLLDITDSGQGRKLKR